MSQYITVRITSTRGSVPREAGTQMQVWADRTGGTIGGGALEWEAIALAREMLTTGQTNAHRCFSLGPDLGQCCGGAVELKFASALPQALDRRPVWIWGAGHVGRAIARVLAPFEERDVFLVDVAPDRLPDILPDIVTPVLAEDPVRIVERSDKQADHLIVTYSHDLDLRLCDALLRHGFASAGLIGSATKWARFRKRLTTMGHSDAQISRICCPIGRPELGKHPQAIAIGVAAALLEDVERRTLGEDIAL